MSKLDDIINLRDEFYKEEERLYLGMVNQINTQMKELLKNDLGNQLVQNCARDFAGEIVRSYLPIGSTGEYYITSDQMLDRILHFRYDNDIDPLFSNDQFRKYYYNNENKEEFNKIINQSAENSIKVVNKSRGNETTDYSKKRKREGTYYDDLTGDKEKVGLEADHILARSSVTYDTRFINESGKKELEKFIDSSDNFQLMEQSPNCSKNNPGDYDDPVKLADKICENWENTSKPEKLKKVGYLDKNGKVPKEIKEKLIKQNKDAMNKFSIIILNNTNYDKVGSQALKNSVNSLSKILAGQLMYYGIPPIIYEAKIIITKKDANLDSFYEKIKIAFQRVAGYMYSKMKDIISNIAHNSLKTFLRNFFDIIIRMLKATVKKVMKMIKQVVMALFNSIKTLGDKNKTAAEKADAVFTTLGITISGIAVNVVIEYLEKQFPFLKPFSDPLQVIITIITTNIVMLILQKADIFNVRYGLMMKKIKDIFESGREEYKTQLKKLEEDTYTNIDKLVSEVEMDMFNVITNICSLDIFEYDMKEEVDKINKIFNMGIDLEEEWNQFAYNN